MFFIISKALAFLTMPLNWILVLMGMSLFGPIKWRKKTLIAAALLMFVFTNPWLMKVTTKAWDLPPVPIQSVPVSEVGIVLGGFSDPSLLPNDRLHVNGDAGRLTLVLELYKAQKIKKILVSSGSGRLFGDQTREADAVNIFLLKMGVPAEDIILENTSKNTGENAQYTAAVLQKRYPNGTSMVLVTSSYHARRSRACFKKAGLQCFDCPAGSTARNEGDSLQEMLVPNGYVLGSWQAYIKEWIGMVAYKAKGYI